MKTIKSILVLCAAAASVSGAFAQASEESRIPSSVTFEGKSYGWNGFLASRSVVYQDGTSYPDQFRHQSPSDLRGEKWASSNFQRFSGKPSDANAQLISFNVTFTNVIARNMLEHTGVIGRLETAGLPYYDGRGLAIYPDRLHNERFIGGYATPAYFGQVDRYEKFLDQYGNSLDQDKNPFQYGNHLDQTPAALILRDNITYRVVMHVNQEASAYWITDPATGSQLAKSWWTPHWGQSLGQGLGFFLLCRDTLTTTTQCTYKFPNGSNEPYKVEYTNIEVSWFNSP